MTVAYILPSRSSRVYRGTYPNRVHSFSYGRSASQDAVATCLNISRPLHMELNDGRRLIVDMKAVTDDSLRLNNELSNCLVAGTKFEELSHERYDEMLKLVREARA